VASFGFLSGVAILGAMAADLFVLPALVVTIARRSASLGAGA
jgi:predicted RND superfamily exporter protein